MNIPNILSLTRIAFLPAFVLIYYLPFHGSHLTATVLFILAAITDWLDGFLARHLNQTSKLGEFLDPVADKLMVSIALVLIVGEFGAMYVTIPAAIIVGREIIISALREWMAELGKRASVAVGMVGKVKTTLQLLAVILLLLYRPHGHVVFEVLGLLLLYVAAILTLWSMIMYLKIAWPDLTLRKDSA